MTRKGFTLIELLVVIAIIGILATLVITQVAGAQVRARNSQAKSNVNEIGKAVELRRTNNNEDLYLNASSTAPTINGTTAAAGSNWTALFSSQSTGYPVTINRTPSTSYTYRYHTDDTDPAGAAQSASFCIGTTIVSGTNGVTDGAFYIQNGTSVQLPNGTTTPTYGSGGTCS